MEYHVNSSEYTLSSETRCKRPYGDVPQIWLQIQPPSISITPFYSKHKWAIFFKKFQNLSQFGKQKQQQQQKKEGNFGQNFDPNWADWYINGSPFLWNCHMYCPLSNSQQHIPIESACGLAEQSRTHKQKVVSSSPVSANMFVSLGKILNLACLVDPSDIWVAVMGDVTI